MPAAAPITIALGHFPDLLGLGLRVALAEDPSLSVVAQDVAYGHLRGVLRAHRPSVLILDVAALPDIAKVRQLSLDHPGTRLVLLADRPSEIASAQLLAFGASACLGNDAQARDVRNAIHLASRGLQLMPIGADAGSASVRDPLLTARESDVLVLLREGQSNAQIALTLHIGVETVRTHARAVFRKLGVSSRRALTALPPPPAPTAAEPARRRTAGARPRAGRALRVPDRPSGLHAPRSRADV